MGDTRTYNGDWTCKKGDQTKYPCQIWRRSAILISWHDESCRDDVVISHLKISLWSKLHHVQPVRQSFPTKLTVAYYISSLSPMEWKRYSVRVDDAGHVTVAWWSTSRLPLLLAIFRWYLAFTDATDRIACLCLSTHKIRGKLSLLTSSLTNQLLTTLSHDHTHTFSDSEITNRRHSRMYHYMAVSIDF